MYGAGPQDYSLELGDVLKKCSVCGTTVRRRDCHKNRYGEYICRPCQANGMRFTPRRQLIHGGKKWVIRFVALVLMTGVFVVLFWWLGQLLAPSSSLDVLDQLR